MTKLFGSILVLALLLPACGGKQHTLAGDDAPAWVNQGSGAFKDAGKRVFYGLGLVSNVKNKALRVSSADNRARAEIGKQLETYSASLMKDYMAATSSGAATSEEQHIEQAIKTVSTTTLNGVMIVDHWYDPTDDTQYSLAKLVMDAFKGALDAASELDAKAKEAIKQNAEKAFDSLGAEEAKRGK